MSMNTAADNIVGVLVVVAVFAALALPSLIGLAHDRRIDRQLRKAQQDRKAQASARRAITAQDVARAA
jgi:Tfp pilus assembly protein FimT